MKRIVFFIACISLSLASLQSQSVAETFQIGEEAYNSGELELAKKYFNRVTFFSKDKVKNTAHLYLGDIYAAQGKYLDAVNNYTYAQHPENSIDKQVDIYFKKVQVWIAMEKYKLAYAETFNIPDKPEYKYRKMLYQAYTLYETGDFKTSKALYLNFVSQENKIPLIHYFNRAYRLDNRSVEVYQYVSYVIPGLGQALNGFYLDALNALILNGGLIAVFIYTSATIGVIEGGVAVVPWLMRYYTGGAEKAKNWAIQKNKERIHAIHMEILELLE